MKVLRLSQKYGNLRNGMFCLLKSLLSPRKTGQSCCDFKRMSMDLFLNLRVCAFLREGVQPAYFADLMKLTTETLTRRISRIKTEKLMLANSKESLEDIVKSLGDLSFCARN